MASLGTCVLMEISGEARAARDAVGAGYHAAVGVLHSQNMSGMFHSMSMSILMALRGPKLATGHRGKKTGAEFLLIKYKSI